MAPRTFVCWSPVTERCEGLGLLLGADVEAFTTRLQRRHWNAPFRYLDMGVRTVVVLLRRKPRGLLVMVPPLPLVMLSWFCARILRVPIVLDLHSAVFEDRKWAWALRPTVWFARRCDLTMVSNVAYQERLRISGVATTIVHSIFSATEDERRLAVSTYVEDGAYVLVPASWHADEPMAEILRAAAELPGVEFRITGRVPDDWLRREVPPNVVLTGYVSNDEYRALVARATVVMSLTRHDNTMQQGGYQALTWQRPLVTSDFSALRTFFGGAAAYARPDAEGIVKAVQEAFGDLLGFEERMRTLLDTRLGSLPAELAPVRKALGDEE